MDITEKIEQSLVHHGKYNDRVYLMKYGYGNVHSLIQSLDNLSKKNNYGKIVAKIPIDEKEFFIEAGYEQEAYIPKFYKGITDCVFMCRYLLKSRKLLDDISLLNDVIKTAKSKAGKKRNTIPNDITVGKIEEDSINNMSQIYRKVFKTYPFSIHDPLYLREIMNDNVDFFGVKKSGKLVALASCEKDKENRNCEMTDFATLPEYRGNGYGDLLLQVMERSMLEQGYKVLYTIARSASYGMNIAFSKCSYTYSGMLINNTNISGKIECMNVWYKFL